MATESVTTENSIWRLKNKVACDHCNKPLVYGDCMSASEREYAFGSLVYVLCGDCGSEVRENRTLIDKAILTRASRFSPEWRETVAMMMARAG